MRGVTKGLNTVSMFDIYRVNASILRRALNDPDLLLTQRSRRAPRSNEEDVLDVNEAVNVIRSLSGTSLDEGTVRIDHQDLVVVATCGYILSVSKGSKTLLFDVDDSFAEGSSYFEKQKVIYKKC